MTTQRFRGPVLPDGEPRDLYVVDGRITLEPVAGAETAAQGWIVPGLVDAHCHIGLDEHGAVDEATTEAQAVADRDAGSLLLRDCGSPADTRWVQQRDDLPRLVRCGRHIARTHRYIRNFAHEIEPDEITAYVAQEAEAGDGWVKLVGDWISRDEGDLAPSFPAEAFAAAIATAHEHGARVTAHCFGETVLPWLVDTDIDCIEHGTGLTIDLVETMAARGTALVPTAHQLNNFPMYAEQGAARFPRYAEHMLDLHARRRDTIMAAYEAGVPIYAGTDAGGVLPHGLIGVEVAELAAYGMPAEYALGAASWRAREWLGWNATLDEGAPADFVVFDRDPREDLSVLRKPVAVVLRGQVVGGQAGVKEPQLVAALRSAGCVFAEDEARLILDETTSPAEVMAWAARRMAGEPLEQIVGWAEFAGLRVAVDPGVFVPRRRSELVVEVAAREPAEVVVDLCCGSAALGAALAARWPDAEVHAADCDPAAVVSARRNLPPERVHEGDLYAALPERLQGQVDLLVVNAPYVPTESIATMPREAREHEHRVALDGGADGLDVQRRVVAEAPAWLRPGGRLVVETGRGQAERTAALLSSRSFSTSVETDDDIGGTVVLGRL